MTVESKDIPLLIRLTGKWVHLVHRCQEEAFADDLARLRKGKPISLRSSLLPLSPLLGPDGYLRLGGRIAKADLPYDSLHPSLLPAKHPFTEKIAPSTKAYIIAVPITC